MEFMTLKELITLHREQMEEISADLDELIEITEEDWRRVRRPKGNIARGRALRTNIGLIIDRIQKLTTEITQQSTEIVEYTKLRDLETTLGRKAEKEGRNGN